MNELQRWLKTRPPSIRRLAARFPIGSRFEAGGKILYLVGYSEGERPGQEGVIASPVDPSADYEGAMAEKVYLCAECLPDDVNANLSTPVVLRSQKS